MTWWDTDDKGGMGVGYVTIPKPIIHGARIVIININRFVTYCCWDEDKLIKGWEKGRLGKNKWIKFTGTWVRVGEYSGGGVRGYDGAGMETLDSPSLWAIHGLTMGFNWIKKHFEKRIGSQ
jgi:hypothetical protein